MVISFISQKNSEDVAGVVEFGGRDAGINETVESVLRSQFASNLCARSGGATRLGCSFAKE